MNTKITTRKKTITAMHARKHFGELMNRVALNQETYIIERAGKPLVTLSPVSATDKKHSKDPFEQPFAFFDEWSDASNDIYDDL